MLDKNKFGLAIGLFLALCHAIWAILVAIMPAQLQAFLDWVFNIHFIKPVWVLTTFNFADAIFLVILTFVFGCIFGWILAALWNWVSCCKTKKARRR